MKEELGWPTPVTKRHGLPADFLADWLRGTLAVETGCPWPSPGALAAETGCPQPSPGIQALGTRQP